MNFDYLVNCQEHIPVIAEWFYRQWAHTNPGRTKDQVVEMIDKHLNLDGLPLSFVGLEKGALVGTVLLREFELKGYEQYSPWLSSIYVAPDYRNQGYGQQLVSHCILAAKNKKFDEIFLYAEKDLEQWYAKMGWTTIDRTIHVGVPISIMSQQLGNVC